MSNAVGQGLLWRLARGWGWVFAQFTLTLLLILAGLAWTRLPDKHAWQVALTLLVPLLLAICALELQAGTVRGFADNDGRRVKLVWGAMALLVWVAVGAACWALLDWCDDQIPLWAGYLNSRFGAHARASLFTYQHIQHGLAVVEWVLRWIVVPGKLIALGAASSLWGWRLPAGRTLRLLLNWRWWAGVIAASMIGVWLPGHFFDKLPRGTVSAQVWSVGLKLAGAYLLAVGSWVLLLAWWATLLGRQKQPPPEEYELVGAPVLPGPPARSQSAAAEIPPADRELE